MLVANVRMGHERKRLRAFARWSSSGSVAGHIRMGADGTRKCAQALVGVPTDL